MQKCLSLSFLHLLLLQTIESNKINVFIFVFKGKIKICKWATMEKWFEWILLLPQWSYSLLISTLPCKCWAPNLCRVRVVPCEFRVSLGISGFAQNFEHFLLEQKSGSLPSWERSCIPSAIHTLYNSCKYSA